MRILKEPKNAILKQYERLLALDEVKLVFEDDALEWIAERALEKDTGARALRAILEDFMMDIMYEIPKDPNIGSVVITRPYLEKNGGPRIEMRASFSAAFLISVLVESVSSKYKIFFPAHSLSMLLSSSAWLRTSPRKRSR